MYRAGRRIRPQTGGYLGKALGIFLFRKKREKVIVMREWMKEGAFSYFNQGKIIFTASRFHQCLKEENPIIC